MPLHLPLTKAKVQGLLTEVVETDAVGHCFVSERRRADKLQERLRDYISETSDPSLLPKAEISVDHDNCSVSSWSLMSGQNEANNSATPSSPFPPTVRNEA